MPGFAKIYASLWDGTLGEHWEGWAVFVFMLACCRPDGVVEKTPEAIAAQSGLPLEVVRKGLAVLEADDPESRSPKAAGARIARLHEHRSWGWRIVNHAEYRGTGGPDETVSADDGAGGAGGYVYFASEPDRVLVKIGFSRNPWARVKDLQCARPKLELIGVRKGTLQDERDLHQQFSELREGGEWFRLTGGLLDLVRSLGKRKATGVVSRVATISDDRQTSLLRTEDREQKTENKEEQEPEEKAGAEAPLVTLPTVNRSVDYPVFEADRAEWATAFPAVNVLQELREMRAWSMANPTQRKTFNGMPAFIVRWLGKEQDRGGPSTRASERGGSRTRADAGYIASNPGVTGE